MKLIIKDKNSKPKIQTFVMKLHINHWERFYKKVLVSLDYDSGHKFTYRVCLLNIPSLSYLIVQSCDETWQAVGLPYCPLEQKHVWIVQGEWQVV